MEARGLAAFYQSVAKWPRTGLELGSAAESICKVLDDSLSFAAVVNLETQPERIGASLSGPWKDESVDPAVLLQFVRRYAKSSDRGSGVHQIQIPRENIPWCHTGMSCYFSILALYEEKKNVGWLVCGTPRPFNGREEVLLQAIADHLEHLAQAEHLNGEIQVRNQFLSIASHELKTPLTSIYGLLQLQERMLRTKKEDPPVAQLERQQSFLRMAIRQVERLNEMIDGLLDVSRIQNGRFMVEPSDTDVAVVLREAVNGRLNAIAQESGVSLNLDAPGNLLAWVDPVRMEEVINNLVMNAIRFSPEGGVVWIRLREDGRSFWLSVRDQGPNVPMEDQERIFQPFERAQRTGRLGGLGLGLFISRQIAQLHGGNVSLMESVPGKGNVFEAHFPVRNANIASA